MMKSREANLFLLSELPELEEKYMDEVKWQEGDDTGSHVVYGDILTPHLVFCIKSNNFSNAKVIFDFIEKALSIKDKYLEEVICLSVLEGISCLFKEDKFLYSLIGKKTKYHLLKF